MNSEITNLIQSIESSTEQVQESFGRLSEAQLNWKAAPERWSVGECLEHVINTNKTYFPAFEKIVNGEHKNTFWQSVSPLTGIWGKLVLKIVSPENPKKTKTPSLFRPSKSAIPPGIITDFTKNNDDCINYFKKFEGVDLVKTRLYSPVTRFITYTLAYVLKIITSHEKRHINQAKKVMETEGFPKS